MPRFYFDTDGDAKTDGFAVPGTREGFEYEARVVSQLRRDPAILRVSSAWRAWRAVHSLLWY